MNGWTPDAGDIVWVDFDPQAGREQAGRRPAVVLSSAYYNKGSSLMVCVPMTTRVKNYPFEVLVAGRRNGVALADHVRSIDWRERGASLIGKASAGELEAIREKVRALVG